VQKTLRIFYTAEWGRVCMHVYCHNSSDGDWNKILAKSLKVFRTGKICEFVRPTAKGVELGGKTGKIVGGGGGQVTWAWVANFTPNRGKFLATNFSASWRSSRKSSKTNWLK